MKKINDDKKRIPFEKYINQFTLLQKEKKEILRDNKSDKNSSLPIKIMDKNVYVSEPDGKLIPNIQDQRKCDFVIYCHNLPQTCFIELKGENIPNKGKYSPYDQIIDTINYFENDNELKNLVNGKVEKQAFIISPGRQKIPKGIEPKERKLWQKLVQPGGQGQISKELIHYVKVTKSDRYSNNKSQIICSPKSPLEIPFQN